MDAAIRCEALSKRYGDVTAVDNLNLSIPAGSVFGFLGRNGAGKTSTIRLLTGLMQATSGNAWINGVHATDPKSRHQFGYLPQEPAFYKWMTPIQFLNYIADLYQMGREKHRQIDEMLERVGLQNVSQRPIRGFSGGMVQRLGIAQAMLHRPPILFLDEPTSALDPSGRYELLTLIESLRGEITIFLSSHILADIERVCDTVAIINQGQLIRVENRDVLLNEFTTNRIHLEVHRASLPQVSTLLTELENQTWLNRVVQDDDKLDLTVRNNEFAQAEILPLLAAHNIQINRLEWKRPSLEEIFLTLSQESS